MIENLDRNIGLLINSLEGNNNIIIFTSDNGGLHGITNQKPLRAGKGSYYEGGIRDPFIFVWKDKIKDNLFATVKFVAEVISVKKDKENKIVEGNPDKIKFVTDSWKFTRNIKQKDFNWYLSEIINK